MPHAIFASQDLFDNIYHGLMPVWRLRGRGSFLVRRGHIRKQVACVLLVDYLQIRQRKQQRLADAEGGHARSAIPTRLVWHLVGPFRFESIARPTVAETDLGWGLLEISIVRFRALNSVRRDTDERPPSWEGAKARCGNAHEPFPT